MGVEFRAYIFMRKVAAIGHTEAEPLCCFGVSFFSRTAIKHGCTPWQRGGETHFHLSVVLQIRDKIRKV